MEVSYQSFSRISSVGKSSGLISRVSRVRVSDSRLDAVASAFRNGSWRNWSAQGSYKAEVAGSSPALPIYQT